MKVGRAFWFVLPAWLVPLITVAVYLSRAPNVITRQATFGSFVHAQIRPPGIFMGTTTTVQTTQGVAIVSDIFTAPTGESLVLRDSTEDGVQLCRQGSQDACADLVGRYVGEIPAIPSARTWLTYSVRQDLKSACLWSFLFGMAGTAMAAVVGGDFSDDGRT